MTLTRISMDKIRVLHIIDHLEIGGAQESMVNCVTSSDKDKFRMDICALYGDGSSYEERLQGYRSYILSQKKYNIFKMMRQIRRVMIREKYDVVHLHLYFSNLFGRIITGLFFRGKIKVLVHKHNNLDTDFGKYIFFPIIVLLEKILFLFTDLVICCSDFVRDYYINSIGFENRKCITFYNGIDMEHLDRETAPMPIWVDDLLKNKKNGLVFGFLARLNYKKAADYLIEAFSLFLNENGASKEHILLIAGYGKEKDKLEKMVKDLDLEKNVFFMGKTKENKRTFFELIDCFVQPSIYETFGITLLESMFFGKPVLAAKTGGIPEVLKNGELGSLFPAKDIEGLKNALKDFVNLRTYRKEDLDAMIFRSKRFVEEMFNMNALASRLEEIYSSLICDEYKRYAGSKILHMIDHMRLGGAQKQLKIMTSGIARDGEISQKIVCLSGVNQETIYELCNENIQVYDIDINFLNFPVKMFRLFRIIVSEKPVILHSMLFYSEIFSRIFGKIAKTRYVISNMRTRYLGKNVFQDMILSLTRTLVDKHIFNSREVYDFARSCTTHKILEGEVIFNAIGESKGQKNSFFREKLCDKYKISPENIIVCTAGRMVYQKGFDILIKAMKNVIVSGCSIKLIIMGKGQDEVFLKWLVRKLNIKNNIIFAGESENVYDTLKGSDFFVFSTRFEGMPNIVMEAMSAGLPIVTTKTDGIAELVEDEQNGILVAGGAKAVSQGILRMIGQRDKWGYYGDNNMKKISECFGNKKMVDSYLEYFKGLLKENERKNI